MLLILLVLQAVPALGGIYSSSGNITTNGKVFNIKLVRAPLSEYAPKVRLANNTMGNTTTLESIAIRNEATAAINGCFFDAYTSSPVKKPYLTIISDGKIMNVATWGTILGFNEQGEYRMEHEKFSLRNGAKASESPEFWSSVTEAIGCGPMLVKNGAISVNPQAEGYSEDKILTMAAQRSAVGINAKREILLLTCKKATIRDLAYVMKALGCVDAMNLDGGASSGLWIKGKYLTRPGRLLSNALLLVKRQSIITGYLNIPLKTETDEHLKIAFGNVLPSSLPSDAK